MFVAHSHKGFAVCLGLLVLSMTFMFGTVCIGGFSSLGELTLDLFILEVLLAVCCFGNSGQEKLDFLYAFAKSELEIPLSCALLYNEASAFFLFGDCTIVYIIVNYTALIISMLVVLSGIHTFLD